MNERDAESVMRRGQTAVKHSHLIIPSVSQKTPCSSSGSLKTLKHTASAQTEPSVCSLWNTCRYSIRAVTHIHPEQRHTHNRGPQGSPHPLSGPRDISAPHLWLPTPTSRSEWNAPLPVWLQGRCSTRDITGHVTLCCF